MRRSSLLAGMMVIALLSTAGCGGGSSDSGGGGGGGGGDGSDYGTTSSSDSGSAGAPDTAGPSIDSKPRIYQVMASKCPPVYPYGLQIEATTPEEIPYLAEIAACQTVDGRNTYLHNGSDAVWVLRNRGTVTGQISHEKDTLSRQSFRNIYGSTLLTPGDTVVINLPPSVLEWDLNLPASAAWQGHNVVVKDLQSLGQAALVDGLAGKGTARAAVVTCTLSVKSTVDDLSDPDGDDLTSAVITGLGAGSTATTCAQAARKVRGEDPATGLTLSQDLERLSRQTETIDRMKGTLEKAQAFSTAAEDVLKFVLSHR
jgi:hypothetical protein